MKKLFIFFCFLAGLLAPSFSFAQIVAKPKQETKAPAPARPKSSTGSKSSSTKKSSSTAKSNSPAKSSSGQSGSIIGSWKDGDDLFTFHNNGDLQITWSDGEYCEGQWEISDGIIFLEYEYEDGDIESCRHEIISISNSAFSYKCLSANKIHNASKVRE